MELYHLPVALMAVVTLHIIKDVVATPDSCSTNVDILDCHRRNLDRIPTIPSTVTTVNLESNRLDRIMSDSFKGATSLSILSFDNNLIRNLQGGWGKDLITLHGLSLNSNRMTALFNATFAGLGSLRSLFQSNNKIRNLFPGWCDSVGNITLLDLSENKISSISRNNWCLFTRLESLNLSSNKIVRLQTGWSVGMVHLRYLYLQNNNLQALNNGSFSFLTSLLFLDLHKNYVKKVDCGWGRDLGKLTAIQLSKNSITTISEGDFLALRSVKRLTLQSNKIYRLEPRSFVGMKALVELYLNNNRIGTLLRGTFVDLRMLTHLYLQNNNIGSLGECWNVDLTNIIYIDMRRNNISVVENGLSSPSHCRNSDVPDPVSLGSGGNASTENTLEMNTVFLLKALYMSRNPVGPVLHREVFKGLIELRYLILSHCHLESVEGSFFKGLQSLKYLDLSHNSIVQLDSGSFESVPSLVAINVQYNSIKFLGAKTFGGKNFSYVDLRENKLQTLSRDVFPKRIVEFELRLSRNPIICDCRIRWLHKLITEKRIRTVDMSFLSTKDFVFPMSSDVPLVKCTNLYGQSLSIIPQNFLPCHPSLRSTVTKHTVSSLKEFPKTTSSRSTSIEISTKGISSASAPLMSTLRYVNSNTGDLSPDKQNEAIQYKGTSHFSTTSTVLLIIVVLLLGTIIIFIGKQSSQCGSNCRNIRRAKSDIYLDINNSLEMTTSTTRSPSGEAGNDRVPDETDPLPQQHVGLTPSPPSPPPRHEDFGQTTNPAPSPARLAMQRPRSDPVIHRKRVVKHTYFRRSLGDVEIRDDSFPTLTQDLEAENNDNKILAKPAIRHLYFRNLVAAASANRQVRTNIQENRSHRFVTEALIHERPACSLLATGEASPLNQSLCETIMFVDRDGILTTSHDSDLYTYGTSNATSFRSDDFERDRESHENGEEDDDASGVIVFDTEIIDCSDQDEMSDRTTNRVAIDELDLASYSAGSTSDIDLSSIDMGSEDNCSYGLDTVNPGDFKKLSRHGYLLGLIDDDSRLEQDSLNFTEAIFQETSV